ncbi:MAG: NUDIX hydrolase [Anaerolineales bacterium]|nr:NUDIX hydrolase [Anaerolineales bacterium]
METIRTLRRTPIALPGEGRFLGVEQHAVEFPSGVVIDDWMWVITPEFVNILPRMQDGRYLCYRQAKYAADGLTLGVPGGYLEPGEAPLAAAQRELLEETGCTATGWIPLGAYVVDGNRGSGRGHFFLATGVEYRQPINADDLEDLEPILLTRHELEAALLKGEFQVMPWTACIALALLHEQE